MELKRGIKLKSKWFKGITVISHVNEEDNDLEVDITNELGHKHHENWNLQHTIWGLENGDYWQTDEELPIEKQKPVINYPHCWGKMNWILKYEPGQEPNGSICRCEFGHATCLKITRHNASLITTK